MATAARYENEHQITGTREDDHDARFSVRRNRKAFHIKVSPPNFINSPATTRKWLLYLEVLQSGEEFLGDIFDTDVYEWAMAPFEPLFVELAPEPPGQGVDMTLQEHLFPNFFVFDLDIVDEKPCPRRIATKNSPYWPSYVSFEEDFLDDLETWTALYDPAGITLGFQNPADALFKPPNKVLIDKGQVECFFKPCTSGVQIKQELKTYKPILAASLDSRVNICHLYGVVVDDHGFILGLLLTYINGPSPLSIMVHPDEPDDPTPMNRERWERQIDSALAEQRKAGVVWGDVKAENILVDKDSNAWLTDFGGGYTEGWVDKELEGTVEGDRVGIEKIKELLVPTSHDSP